MKPLLYEPEIDAIHDIMGECQAKLEAIAEFNPKLAPMLDSCKAYTASPCLELLAKEVAPYCPDLSAYLKEQALKIKGITNPIDPRQLCLFNDNK